MADADAEDVVDYGWEDEEEDEQNETNQGDGTTNFQDELEQACRDFVRQKKKEAKENPNLTAKWPSQRGGYSHQRGGGWGAAGGGGKKGAQSNSISPKQNVVTSATLLHFVQENYGRWETLGLEGGFAAFASKILDTAEEKAAALLATFFEKDDLMKLLCLKVQLFLRRLISLFIDTTSPFALILPKCWLKMALPFAALSEIYSEHSAEVLSFPPSLLGSSTGLQPTSSRLGLY